MIARLLSGDHSDLEATDKLTQTNGKMCSSSQEDLQHVSVDIAAAIGAIKTQIQALEQQYQRESGSVQLLAVSKTKPISAIATAMAAGQRAFGENYVDEAVEKITTLAQRSAQRANAEPLESHFIGAIQSRKTKLIATHFDWVHSIDREKVAARLNDQRPEELGPLNICLQVNLDAETSKAGVPLDAVESLLGFCLSQPRLRVRGLMCIPAPQPDFASQRAGFRRLSEKCSALAREHPGLDTLSMGMTADLQAAIAEGATIVRVGTALFGRRD